MYTTGTIIPGSTWYISILVPGTAHVLYLYARYVPGTSTRYLVLVYYTWYQYHYRKTLTWLHTCHPTNAEPQQRQQQQTRPLPPPPPLRPPLPLLPPLRNDGRDATFNNEVVVAAAAADFRGTKLKESSKQGRTKYAWHHVVPTRGGRPPQHPSLTRSGTSASAPRDSPRFIHVVKILITLSITTLIPIIQSSSLERVSSVHTDSSVVATTTRPPPQKQGILLCAWAKDALRHRRAC